MLSAQDDIMTNKDVMSIPDTNKITKICHSNIVAVSGKYLFKTLQNTRNILTANGFSLDQEAYEYQLRLYNLPKVYYYQQLGNLVGNKYVSVTGIGIKEDLRFPLFKTSNFIFTPYIEVGGGYFRMNIAEGVSSNTIVSVLNSEVTSHQLDNIIFTGDVGLDLGFRFKADDRSISVIINGGFMSNFPSEWRLASSLAFKEKINLSSPYCGVTVAVELYCKNDCCK